MTPILKLKKLQCIYIYIYIHITYIYIYIYIYYIYVQNVYVIQVTISDPRHRRHSNLTEARWAQHICNHENNIPWLSSQWLCANSCTWIHEVRDVHWASSPYIRTCWQSYIDKFVYIPHQSYQKTYNLATWSFTPYI